MIKFGIPDAKNEVDDQFAIVQAALSDSMDIKAFIAAHYGWGIHGTGMND